MRHRLDYIGLAEVFQIPLRGGHVVWLHEVARRLGDVRILAGKRPGHPAFTLLEGVEVQRISLPRWTMLRPESLPLYTNYYARLLTLALSRRPKALLSASVLPEGLVGNAVGRLLGIPNAIFAHGEEVHRLRPDRQLSRKRRLTASIKRRCLWRAFSRADVVIANSQFTAELLRAGVSDPSRVAVVHPGTDPMRYRPMDRDTQLAEQLGVRDKKVIFTVGRLVHRKGQDTVIQAMRQISEKVPDAVYLIAGGGECEQDLRQLAERLGVTDRVRFMGPADEQILPQLYNLSDVFVMANREMSGSGDLEGFGIVFLEAAACEVPTIGGRSGGVPDAIVDGQTGLLVDGGSTEEVAQAIIHLLTDRDVATRMGRAGRQRVCQQLTWDHSASRIRDLLDNCAVRKRRRSH
jgi:phosphatidyl-myo-inositol dimannoside synthase